MTTMIDEVDAPAGVMNRSGGGRETFDGNRLATNSQASGIERKGPDTLPLDQTFPRLLYELAIRLPALREIQAVCVWLYEPAQHEIRPHLLMADLPPERRASMAFPLDDSIAAWVWKHQEPLTINTESEHRFPDFATLLLESGMKSFCGVPLMIADCPIGVLGLASTRPEAFRDFNWEFVQRGPGDTASLARILRDNEISTEEDDDSSDESLAIEEEAEPVFKGIIGRSSALRALLKHVAVVAPTDSTVLISGETGSGKELIAQAIHDNSPRCKGPLIKVNCSAIPENLFESEFFGHARGAFTGALRDKPGRFEMADGGTLFLDEIGELPPAMQSKLLRVLQEQEIERVGEIRTRKVNVRVIAATNRDLKQEVEGKRFREDLFYRLSVFPLEIPPLRERREDIPALATYFLRKTAKKMNRPLPRLSRVNANQLSAHAWPGNVRELQNAVERAVILAKDGELRFDLRPSESTPSPLRGEGRPSLRSASDEKGVEVPAASRSEVATRNDWKRQERESIMRALQQAGGKVSGSGGAAELLGMRPTTLSSRLKAMGITRQFGLSRYAIAH
ncbi:MAG: hydrogenase-4 transcriptional activator [Verrucomicrobiota bacterium]